MSETKFSNHFDAVRDWLRRQNFSDERALALLESYKDQHEAPFAESNKVFGLSLLLAGVFYLKFYGVEFSIKVFELDLIAIPNALFVLPLFSLIALTYAAVRAADAAYYQKLIEVIASETLDDENRIISRGFFGGKIISSNFMDIWKSVPSQGFRFWFVALASTSGLALTLLTLVPYAAGITYIFWINGTENESAVNAQMIMMIVAEVVAVIAGAHVLLATDLDNAASDSAGPKI